MRFTMLIFALALVSGCHKTSSSPLVPPGPPTFQFTANGTVYNMNGNLEDSSFGAEFIGKIGGCITTDTMYYLQAKDSAGNAFMISTEPITSLAVATYPDSITLVRTDPNGSTCSDAVGRVTLPNLSSEDFLFSTKADYSIITVATLHQGLADGTFSAHLTLLTSSPDSSITVTDGQFKNIPVVNP